MAVNRLQRCDICYAEAEEEERHKQFQLEEFKALHAAEAHECNSGGDMYCVSSGWFRAWESWVLGRARDTPGRTAYLLDCCVKVIGTQSFLGPPILR